MIDRIFVFWELYPGRNAKYLVMDENEQLLFNFIENKRPPSEIREKLDLGYMYEDQVVEIFEIRPDWRNPQKKSKFSIARTKFIKSRLAWKIYWKRADLKWHPYEPQKEVNSLLKFLEIIEEDAHGCFWG